MPGPKNTGTRQVLNLDDFLPFLLSTSSNAVSNLVAQAYQARFGLNIPQWRLLAVLAESQGLTQQEICDRTIMDKVTVSRAAHALVGRGLIARSPNSSDGRSHVLILSGVGRRLVSDVTPAALAIEQALFDTFNAKEMEVFASLLRRVRTRAEAAANEEPTVIPRTLQR
jgi:DNA-binding MarR family transcriptional regulator